MFTPRTLWLTAGLLALVAGCDANSPALPADSTPTRTDALPATLEKSADPDAELSAMLDAMNAALSSGDADYRAVVAEWIGDPDGGQAGGTVIAKDVGNKQLSSDFVPFDARRPWSGPLSGMDDITYAIDRTGDAAPVFGGLTGAQTDAAIVRGHETWEGLSCSTLSQVRNDDFGLDIGLVAFQISGGAVGSPFVFADLQHAGWRDLNFGGGILGVTFTFNFCAPCSPTPVFTDVDGNGKLDVAFREIYYDPSFSWADDGSSNIDVESVAVHEIGHGLSQAHFGTVRIKKNGDLQASPRAVMNALYAGPFRDLAGTDNGGHCSNWAQWPNN